MLFHLCSDIIIAGENLSIHPDKGFRQSQRKDVIRIIMNGATIRDIAKSSGVSIATVSRALNSPSKVRPSTLSRIQKAMVELNYTQYSPADRLIPATRTIGFIVSNLCNSHFAYMAKEIEQTLREEEYSLIICNTDDDPQLELQHIKQLLSLNVDGLIINSTCMNNEYIEEISHSIPVVLAARRTSDAFHGDYVGSNNAGGTEQLTRHLLESGHRRIGMVTSDLRFSTGRERLEGYRKALTASGMTVDEDYIYQGSFFNEMGGMEGCQYLLSLPEPPTAVVLGNNSMAIGAYKYLLSQKIRVPEDLSVASFGDIDNCTLFQHTPTIVTLSPTYIGQKAATCLLSRIQNHGLPNREIIYEPTLVPGETTMPVFH